MLGTAGAKLKEEEPQLTPEFVDLVKQAQEEPEKLAVLELCASLHVYTGFLIEGFVEHAAKLLKFNMVEHLGETLEDTWREELGGSALHELFPKDEGIARQREALMACMRTLQDFKACGRPKPASGVRRMIRLSRERHYRRELQQCAGRTSGSPANLQTSTPPTLRL